MEGDNIQINQPQELQGIRSNLKTSRKAISKSSSLVYTGETDLTIGTLEKLKGHAFVSKQFISDLIRSPNFKKAEVELISHHLALHSEGAIRVQEFAKQVKEELLPLKRNSKASVSHSNTVLNHRLRGDVTNYGEHIYSSPIITSAGNRHFSNLSGEKKDNYFAHCRTEDISNSNTRRIIEIQSDLFQKNRLEEEQQSIKNHLAIDTGWDIQLGENKYTVIELYKHQYSPASAFAKVSNGKEESYLNLYDENILNVLAKKRTKELSQLEVYRNIWHERIIQGEIRQAAKDKKTSLLFPTGETAMKIENLSREYEFHDVIAGTRLSPENIETGKEISRIRDSEANRWIIQSVLNAGQFTAVQKSEVEKLMDIASTTGEKISYAEALHKIAEGNYYVETFDASKTNADNPIYRFYEKEVQKCLAKFGGKRIVDEKGVSWIEIPVSKELAKIPIMAFSLAGLELTKGRSQELEELRNTKDNNEIHRGKKGR